MLLACFPYMARGRFSAPTLSSPPVLFGREDNCDARSRGSHETRVPETPPDLVSPIPPPAIPPPHWRRGKRLNTTRSARSATSLTTTLTRTVSRTRRDRPLLSVSTSRTSS